MRPNFASTMYFCTARDMRNGSAQVDVHHRIPLGNAHLEQKVVASDAGIVDQHGRCTQFCGNTIHCCSDRSLVGDVSADGQCLSRLRP